MGNSRKNNVQAGYGHCGFSQWAGLESSRKNNVQAGFGFERVIEVCRRVLGLTID